MRTFSRRAAASLSALVALVACGSPSAAPPPQVESHSPTAPSTAPTEQTGPSDVLGALAQGPAPRIAFTEGYTYVEPDGTRTALPRGRGISGITPYDGGFVISDTRYFEGTVGLAVVDAQGRRVEQVSSSGTPLPGVDGGDPVWVSVIVSENLDPQEAPTVRRGATVQTLDPTAWPDSFAAVGRLGDRVVLSDVDGAATTDLVRPPVPVRMVRVVDAVSTSAGLLVGAARSGRGPQSVVDPDGPRRLWTTPPGVRVQAFAPDGRRLLGLTRRGADRRLLVLDSRTGAVEREVALPDGLGVEELVWEDRDHVLGVAHDRDFEQSTIVRIGLDGSLARTVPVVDLLPGTQGYVVPRRP